MKVFKFYETYYVKSLLMIFKDDTCKERLSKIVHICINIYQEIINDENNKKLVPYYSKEILEILEKFKNITYYSEFKEIENECKIKSAITHISIEKEIKIKTEDNYLVNYYNSLSFEEILFALDQNTYTIKNLGYMTNAQYEKEIKALLLTKFVTLKILCFKKLNLHKLEEIINEAETYVKLAGLEPKKNKWIYTLYDNKITIEQKIYEQREINRSKMEEWQNDIDGNNDEENIEFFENIYSNYMTDKLKKKLDGKTPKNLYYSPIEDDKQKLKRSMSLVIDAIPEEDCREIKDKKNMFKKILNKICKFLKIK